MHLVMVPMPKNFVVNIGKETKKLALVKAGQIQERLGRRVTIEQTVKGASSSSKWRQQPSDS